MSGSRLVAFVAVASGCGGATRYHTELVGSGNGMVSSRASGFDDAVGAPGAGGIQLAQGTYEIAMRFEVPRAQVVDWRIVCPGATIDGQAGETLEQYRARRIEQLRHEREDERDRVSAVSSIVVGAVSPRVEARGHNSHVSAGVDPNTAGDAIANGVVDPTIVLAPDDIGRGSFSANARVMTGTDGTCTLQVAADDSNVRAGFTVTRIRDLEAEQRMRTIATREVAVKARGRLSTQLVAGGADPGSYRAKVDARVDLRARHEAAALYARQEYLFYLSGKCNAKPHDPVREADRVDADILIAQRRDQLALKVRADISAQLLALGAKARPPRPEPIPETPGAAPHDGAEWQPGYWSWVANEWEWQGGAWLDAEVFDSRPEVVHTNGTGNGYTHTYQTGERDHRRGRDHERDSRGGDNEPFRALGVPSHDKPRETSRDHRDSEPRDRWTPKDDAKVRDHRDDKKDDDNKKDDKPSIRDHR